MKTLTSRSTLFVSALLVASTSVTLTAATANKNILATVDGVTISSQELQARIDAAPAQYAEALKTKEVRSKLLDDMINEKLILNAAQKKGIERTPEYKKDLQLAQNQLALSTYVRQLIKANTVSDDEAKAYFDANAAQYGPTEFRAVSHILLANESDAVSINSQLKSGGVFSSLAREKSLDPSAVANGGNLGVFSKGQMLPEIDAIAFTLKKGDISGPIKSQFGYHIVKVEDIRVRPQIEFNTVKEQIREGLLAEKNRKTLAENIETLKKTSKIKKEESQI
ncbi:hypothetical protein EB093_01335 [bacterium]|nr:hypothetical protein [bacterium]